MSDDLEWFDDGETHGFKKVEPKPFDNIPFGEQYPKKSITFTNNTRHIISIGQLPSDWNSVNFVIEDWRTETKYKIVKWLATLEPTDKIELTFNKPKEIKP